MTQIGSKEIKRVKRSIESGEYDLEKCMNLRNAKLRVELARRGLHVDMLAERNEPRVIVALIENGYAEYLDRYEYIQQKLESVNIAIEKAKEKEIKHILAVGAPANPYDVLQVLHARFDYRGKSSNELETLKQEARRLFATFDESVDYTQYKY